MWSSLDGLENEQLDLFKNLVEARRSVARVDREPFLLIKTLGYSIVHGNGLKVSIADGDIETLIDRELLVVSDYQSGKSLQFRVSPKGFATYDGHIQRKDLSGDSGSTIRNDLRDEISDRTIREIGSKFAGGDGPSHNAITSAFQLKNLSEYLPAQQTADGASVNKQTRILKSLGTLRHGRQDGDDTQLPPDIEGLRAMVLALAELLEVDLSDDSRLSRALIADGMRTDQSGFLTWGDGTLASHLVNQLIQRLSGDVRFETAKEHYEQALTTYDQQMWEAANASFRSAFDATFKAIAVSLGCSPDVRDGNARMWLQEQEHLTPEEGALLLAFSKLSHANGSHSGLSSPTECELRRHFTSALMAFGIAKFGKTPQSG